MSYKVTASEKDTNKVVAEYIFETLKEAQAFHAGMVIKGYHSILQNLYD